MRRARVLAVVVLAVAWVAMSGCAMFNRTAVHYERNTTIGKELVDLKDAKDKGVISDDEYLKAKQAILAGGPVQFEQEDDDEDEDEDDD